MSMNLEKAIDLAVRGKFPDDGVRVNGHGFFVRALVGSDLLKTGETGYLRHEHIGKDDRIFYSIKVLDKSKGTFTAKITRIQFRGPFNSGTKKFGPTGVAIGGLLGSTGVAVTAGAALAAISAFLKDFKLQAMFDGDFVSAAIIIINKIGARLAKQ